MVNQVDLRLELRASLEVPLIATCERDKLSEEDEPEVGVGGVHGSTGNHAIDPLRPHRLSPPRPVVVVVAGADLGPGCLGAWRTGLDALEKCNISSQVSAERGSQKGRNGNGGGGG